MYDTRKAQWLEDPLDDALRARALPAGLEIALRIEDRAIILPARAAVAARNAALDLTPQVMLFSSGELTSFQLTLARSGTGRSATITGTSAGVVKVGSVQERST